ncbi:MAG: beta-lactamase family protein [Gammaproteobacteria bacterium]|nr:beta-lactamase family protein [Gammaproteobacteria bacterium]
MRTITYGAPVAILLNLMAAPTIAAELTPAKPAVVGFSAARLEQLDESMKALVDQGELAGIVTHLTRHGRVVNFSAYGKQDLASGAPMRTDSIFRIYSMTKPITGVAMMILYEQGKWHPEDPLAKYIPEFADLKVFSGTDRKGALILKPPGHAPTVGEVMSHTAGFTYGFFGDSPVDKMYQQDNPLAKPSLQAFIERLAEIPLSYQPGDAWVYSVSVDIQGYLVEKLSGMPLPTFMQKHIFDPLEMVDTGFAVPADKLDRLATIYGFDKAQGLTPLPRDPNVSVVPGLPSGGGGLYSTARDYARFAQMLANGGELDGARILSPATVGLMRANHLPDKLMTGEFGIGFQRMRPGFGFGYDVAVFEDPHQAGSTTGQGTYLWDGAAGTWFWIDPTNDVVFVAMIQRMMSAGGMPQVQNLSRALVHAALTEPER